jgi:SAM-dependent methyltransferase
MLAFRHLGQSHQLAAGELYSRAPDQLYADTPAATLRGIVAEIEAGAPWAGVIDRHYRTANPWLHQIVCDPSRNAFFREILPPRGLQVLDVGSGWGQQALELARHNRVCAVEPNPDRLAFIRAAARQEARLDSLYFLAANFQDLEFEASFDLATCIGVLEWVGKFSPLPDPQEAQRLFLQRLHAVLKPGGRLVIGIENRLGLKYLMHSRDDHTGAADISCLPYEQANRLWRQRAGEDLRVITYSEPEYRRLLAAAGFTSAAFYAAYPDYKLSRVILPCDPAETVNRHFLDGKFEPEHDGHDGSPLAFQAELAAQYRSFAEAGLAAAVAPSYFIVATK